MRKNGSHFHGFMCSKALVTEIDTVVIEVASCGDDDVCRVQKRCRRLQRPRAVKALNRLFRPRIGLPRDDLSEILVKISWTR